MATVFQSLATQRGIRKHSSDLVIELARNYAPQPGEHDYLRRSDAPWVKRFAAAGGTVIISGDKKMRSNTAEREALVEAGMIVFFFDPAWNNMPFCDKCAMLLRWWPTLLQTAATAASPSFWRVPATWKSDVGIVQASHADFRLERIERQKAAAPAVRARRAARRKSDPAQGMLGLPDAAKNEETDDDKKPA